MTAVPPRDILAANLKRLISKEESSVRGWAMARGLDVRLIDRLTKGEHAVTLDNLDRIATACGLQSWQLLLEDFDPQDPPSMPISADERAMLVKLRRLLT